MREDFQNKHDLWAVYLAILILLPSCALEEVAIVAMTVVSDGIISPCPDVLRYNLAKNLLDCCNCINVY